MGDVYMSSSSAMYVDVHPLKFLHAFWSTPWWQVQRPNFHSFKSIMSRMINHANMCAGYQHIAGHTSRVAPQRRLSACES